MVISRQHDSGHCKRRWQAVWSFHMREVWGLVVKGFLEFFNIVFLEKELDSMPDLEYLLGGNSYTAYGLLGIGWFTCRSMLYQQISAGTYRSWWNLIPWFKVTWYMLLHTIPHIIHIMIALQFLSRHIVGVNIRC